MFLANTCSNHLETVKCSHTSSTESDRQDLAWDSYTIKGSQSSDSEFYEEKQITTQNDEPPFRPCHSDHECSGAPAVEIQYECTTSVDLPPLSWHGYNCIPKFLSISKTAQSIVIKGQWSNGKPYLQGGPLNGNYIFSQIHFHCPSEHELDGKRYPLEMHVVHYKTSYLTQERAMEEKDGTVVLVYLFEVMDTDDTILSWLTKQCSQIKEVNKPAEIAGFALNQIVKPFYSHYYIYWGSVSTKKNCYVLQWIINCSNLYATKQEVHDLFQLMNSGVGNDGGRMHLMKPVNNSVYYAGGYSMSFRGLDDTPPTYCRNFYSHQVSSMTQCCQSQTAKETKKDAQLQVSLSDECNDFIKLYFQKPDPTECYEKVAGTCCHSYDDNNKERHWKIHPKMSNSSMEISLEDLECLASSKDNNFELVTVPSNPIACMDLENPPCESQETPKKKKLTIKSLTCDKFSLKKKKDCNTTCGSTVATQANACSTANNNTNICSAAENTNVHTTLNDNTNVCNTGENTNVCSTNENTNDCNTVSNNTNDCNTVSNNTNDCNTVSNNTNVCNTSKNTNVHSTVNTDVCIAGSSNLTSECRVKKVIRKDKSKSESKALAHKNKKEAKERESRKKMLFLKPKVKSKAKVIGCEKIVEANCEEKKNCKDEAPQSQDCTVNYLLTPNTVHSIPSFPLIASESEEMKKIGSAKGSKTRASKLPEKMSKASASACELLPKAREPLTEFCIQTEHLFHTENNENFSACTTQDYTVAIIHKHNILQEFKGAFSPNKLEVGNYEKLDLTPAYPERDNVVVRVEDCTIKMDKSDQLSVRAKFLLKQIDSNAVQGVDNKPLKKTAIESMKAVKVEPKSKLATIQKKNTIKVQDGGRLISSVRRPRPIKYKKQKQSDQLAIENEKSKKQDNEIKLLKGPPKYIETSKTNILDTDQLCEAKIKEEKSLKSLNLKSDKSVKSFFEKRKKTIFFSCEKVEKDENSGKKVFVGKFKTENEMKALSKEKKLSQNKNEPTPEKTMESKEESFFSLSSKDLVLEEVIKYENPVEQRKPNIKSIPKRKEPLKLDKEKNVIILHYYNPEHLTPKGFKSKTRRGTSQNQGAIKTSDESFQQKLKSEMPNLGSLKIKIPKSPNTKDPQTPQLIIPLELDTRNVKETSIEVFLSEDSESSGNKNKKKEKK